MDKDDRFDIDNWWVGFEDLIDNTGEAHIKGIYHFLRIFIL